MASAEPSCYLPFNGMSADNSKINISFYPVLLKKQTRRNCPPRQLPWQYGVDIMGFKQHKV